MPHNGSNILELVLYRDNRLGTGQKSESEPDLPTKPEDEIRAIVSSLEYLYGETIKLDRRMAAHLIGAAAEALRQDRSQTGGDDGGSQ
jgi:hypothetical protein